MADDELHQLYAAAIHEDAQRPSGERVGIINAVLAARDIHIEQLTNRLGQYADRAIKNGERADEMEKLLEEFFSVFVPVTSDTDDEDVAGYVPLVHPRDYKRWETAFNKLKGIPS